MRLKYSTVDGLDRFTVVRKQGMNGKKSGSKHGGFLHRSSIGLSFRLCGSRLALTQKQSKNAGVWVIIEMT